MDREMINKVLELTELQGQLNDLDTVLGYRNPTRITVTNDTGISKSFNWRMIKELNQKFEQL